MGTPEHPDFASGLIDGLRRHASAAHVADRLRVFCVDIDGVLSPILGRRGVAALMHRSLRVAGVTHPWLIVRPASFPATFDSAALIASVLVQDSDTAVAGAAALIRTFCDLVGSLIGASLTERLLGPILAGTTSDPTVPGQIE